MRTIPNRQRNRHPTHTGNIFKAKGSSQNPQLLHIPERQAVRKRRRKGHHNKRAYTPPPNSNPRDKNFWSMTKYFKNGARLPIPTIPWQKGLEHYKEGKAVLWNYSSRKTYFPTKIQRKKTTQYHLYHIQQTDRKIKNTSSKLTSIKMKILLNH